jgi:hypothetical protein
MNSPEMTRPVSTRVPWRDDLKKGLVELLRAFTYARELGTDVWSFAVEIQALRASGLSDNDLRWFICRGLLEHAGEVTRLGEDVRTFRHTGRLRFCRRTCFVLTPLGAEQLVEAPAVPGLEEPRVPLGLVPEEHAPPSSPLAGPCEPGRPHWDAERQELRMGRVVVKQFKVPARNQEIVLAAFEEEGWPCRIDDPIPPQYEIDPKRRLHDTINSLNRCQRSALIRFLGDGRGLGIRWEPVEGPENPHRLERIHLWSRNGMNGHC